MSEKVVVTKSYLQDIGKQIIAKGGASAPMKPSEMAEAIAAIPSGGGEWAPPDEWRDASGNKIDLRKIVDENPPEKYGYPSDYVRVGYLLSPVGTKYSFRSYTNCITDEGPLLSAAWTPSVAGYHWVIKYAPNDSVVSVGVTVDGYPWYQSGRPILWIVGDGDVKVDCGFQAGTDFALRLQSVERCNFTLYLDGPLNAGSYTNFTNANSLVQFKDCTFGTASQGGSVATNLFGGVYALREIPDFIDFTDQNVAGVQFLNAGYAVRKFVSVVPNKSISSSINYALNTTRNVDPYSLAKFDGAGNIISGVAAFKTVGGKSMDATGSAGTRTYTVPRFVQYCFSSSEWNAVVSAFSDHGWTLSVG